MYISCHLTRHPKQQSCSATRSARHCSSALQWLWTSFSSPQSLSRSRLGFSTTNGCLKQATPSEVFGVFGVSYFHFNIYRDYNYINIPRGQRFPNLHDSIVQNSWLKPNLEYIEYVLEYGIPEISILSIVYAFSTV